MSIDTLAHGLPAALALAGLLGFRHGFDADHIAVVDGLTRARQLQGSYWAARGVGLQFAAGHSATVLIVALLLFGQASALPAWLDGLGSIISIGFLLLIAFGNLVHACSPAGSAVRPPGPMATLLSRLSGRQLHPSLVGVAFALSLDSMAQAAFFASHGGSGTVVALACTFGAGMILADAGNGALLSWFAQRSDRLARQASRFSSGFIACIALFTVAASLLRESRQGFAAAWDGAGPWVGVGLLVLSSLVYGARIVFQRHALLARQGGVAGAR